MEGIDVARASAICQRRQQLGLAPMVTLFRDVCHPLATPNTCDAYLFGLRLMAVDGTVEDVADTPANASYFGRQTGLRGDSAFPQMRCVYLCDVEPMPSAMQVSGLSDQRTERWFAGVAPRLEQIMLVMWDRGFHILTCCARCSKQKSRFFLAVSRRLCASQPISRLPDGSYLASIRPSEYKRR